MREPLSCCCVLFHSRSTKPERPAQSSISQFRSAGTILLSERCCSQTNADVDGMSWAERYRGYAAECVRLAQHLPDPADKALLVEMAENWIRMAERAEARVETDDAGENG